MRAKKHLRKIEQAIALYDEHDPQTSVQDIIADLYHYCDAHDISFDDAQGYAERVHYSDETDEWAKRLPLKKIPLLINSGFGDFTEVIQHKLKDRLKYGK